MNYPLQGCIVWGSRVVMPLQGRQMILNELHQDHQGMVGMKSRARSIVWWPNIDKEIEAMVRKMS